jgi:zinc protease
MLAELLGGNGATSVLGQKLQFTEQKAIYTSAFYNGLSYDDTTFGLVIVPVPGVSLTEAEAAMDKAVAEFIAEGVDAEQLARIKMQMRASKIYEEDSIRSLAQRYGSALTAGLTVEDIDAWPGILQAVTAEDVIAAANSVFDRKRSVTGWLMKPETAEVTQ